MGPFQDLLWRLAENLLGILGIILQLFNIGWSLILENY